MTPGAREIVVHDERIRLLPEGAVHWPSERLLIVADFHLQVSDRNGAMGTVNLKRLERIRLREGADSVLFLGDLVLSARGMSPSNAERFIRGLDGFSRSIYLVAGHTDRALLKRWPKSWSRIEILTSWKRGPFIFRHELPNSRTLRLPGPFYWAGHFQPVLQMYGGAERIRLKTFVIGKNYGLIPAFTDLMDGNEIGVLPELRFFPIADGEVLDFN